MAVPDPRNDAIAIIRRAFLADIVQRNQFPPNRPPKLFVDLLFTAINTGSLKDIQRSKIWITDSILPSTERTRRFLSLLVAVSRNLSDGALPTAAARDTYPGASIAKQPADVSAERKRLNILNVLSDVIATLHPSQLEIPKKRLPELEKSSVSYELKHHIKILAQLAACEASRPDSQAAGTASFITDVLIPNWVKRGFLSPQDGDELSTETRSCARRTVHAVAEALGLDQQAEDAADHVAVDIVIDRVLPSHHNLVDHPQASWDTAPAANGLFLKRIRGYPLRAGGLQSGLLLQNAGKQSSDSTKADIIATYKTGALLTRRFTDADSIADIDELGNVVPATDPEIRPLNYAAIPKAGIDKILALQERFQRQSLGYDGVSKLNPLPKFDSPVRPARRTIDSDVQRAVALAQGGGGGGGPGAYGEFGDARSSHGSLRANAPIGRGGASRGGWNSGRGEYGNGGNGWR